MERMNSYMKEIITRITEKAISFFSAYKMHLLWWIIYIIYESVIIGMISGIFGKLENYIVHYTLNIFLFYLHMHLLTRMGFHNKGIDYAKIFVLIILEVLVYIPILALLNQLFTDYNQPLPANPLGLTIQWSLGAVYRSLFFIIISTAYWSGKRFYDQKVAIDIMEKKRLSDQVDKEILEKSLIKAQNSYLRAQVNPHFIFNTLSFVYRRVRKVDSDSGDLIIHLADILRYATDELYNEEYILLEQEIAQVTSLISLFRLKETRPIFINFEYDEVSKKIKIIPLALLTIVENVFKHGIYHDSKNPVEIIINCSDEYLTIKTKNLTAKQKSTLDMNTGLDNLNKRLTGVYGENSTLTWASGTCFILELKIKIEKSEIFSDSKSDEIYSLATKSKKYTQVFSIQ